MAVEVNHARVGKVKVGGVPVKLKKTPGMVRLAPPILGQHTHEVLQELGISDAEMEKLRQQGVVK
jgi:formyl-CoA transferase/CoA:oxalate CoA-transferase